MIVQKKCIFAAIIKIKYYDDHNFGETPKVHLKEDIDNTINYNNKYIAPKQCIIECNNDEWKIKNLNSNAVVFVNSNAIMDQVLNIGDQILKKCTDQCGNSYF